jgi:hypothetical protein
MMVAGARNRRYLQLWSGCVIALSSERTRIEDGAAALVIQRWTTFSFMRSRPLPSAMHRIGPACAIRLSSVQVDLPFERSSSSRRPRREIDSVEPHHRKRSSGSSEPASSVLDRRNFRNPRGIWWNEDTFTNKCARQLVAIRRSEREGPSSGTVGIDLSCKRSGEPTEFGRSTLRSPARRRGRNLESRGERTAKRQFRATSRRHYLSRPQPCIGGRRRP